MQSLENEKEFDVDVNVMPVMGNRCIQVADKSGGRILDGVEGSETGVRRPTKEEVRACM